MCVYDIYLRSLIPFPVDSANFYLSRVKTPGVFVISTFLCGPEILLDFLPLLLLVNCKFWSELKFFFLSNLSRDKQYFAGEIPVD
jgi:hypothetical protein